MVSVGLYTRAVIPTIRSVAGVNYGGNDGYSNTTSAGAYTVAVGSDYSHITVPVGETCFASANVYNNTYATYGYGAIRSSEDLATNLTSYSKYHSGTVSGYVEYKNITGAPTTLQLFHYSNTSNLVKSRWTRILFMNDSDLAKWERVNLPTTRYRKYAVDKYYMLAKFTQGSFNIDGYAVNLYEGGILEVPVETIISSTALTGSNAHFFQVTGQGFTVTA